MGKHKATIHDIARALNVTASTVSRALNNNPRISEETKKAVLKVAKKLHYQPNHIAAALRNGKSNIIGIIVPNVDRASFSSVVRGIEEIANKARYNVMVAQTYDDYDKEVATVNALLNARVDGIIASHSKSTEDFSHFAKVKERGIPLILFDRSNDQLKVSQVLIDDYLGAYRATEHLIQQGSKRIAHFTSTLKISIFLERFRGYKDALTANGLKFDPTLVVESNLQLEDGRNSMIKLLASRQLPDAVFSASAFGIMGALQICNERGIKVPHDIALVGFSNEPFTSFTEPAITSVEQYSMRIGNAAAQIFLKEVSVGSKGFVAQKVVLTPDLVVRQSSLRKVLP